MLKKVLLASIALVATPAEAKDDWWMAESDHFRVISEGGKSEAEKVAVNLERLDQAMRLFRGLPLDSGEVRDGEKVTLYQTGRTSDIGDLAHSQGVAGFFIPRAGNSVAFVPLEPDRESRGRLGAQRAVVTNCALNRFCFTSILTIFLANMHLQHIRSGIAKGLLSCSRPFNSPKMVSILVNHPSIVDL